MRKDVEDILKKYKEKLGDKFDTGGFSREYKKFKFEHVEKKLSLYEKLCNLSEKIVKIRVEDKKRNKLLEDISRINLKVSPEGTTSFAVLFGLSIIFLGVLFFALNFMFKSMGLADQFYLFPVFFLIVLGVLIMKLFVYSKQLSVDFILRNLTYL